MNNSYYRFRLGDFECVSVSDGSADYPLESFFANVPAERAEKALRVIDVTRDERHYSPAQLDVLQPGDLITIFIAQPHAADAALTSLFS